MIKEIDMISNFRPGGDRCIFESIINKNGYHLPDSIDPNDVIIDIGAHIGIFVYACLQRGSKNIYAYEVLKNNCEILKYNLSDDIKKRYVKIANLAVWRSDIKYPVTLRNLDSAKSTGISTVVYRNRNGEPVSAVSLDRIINAVGRVKLIKSDCEGSEYPIFLTSKMLHLVDYICGEYHEGVLGDVSSINGKTRFGVHDLLDYLDSQDFNTISFKTSPRSSMGAFFAKKKGMSDFFKDIRIP